MFQICRKIFTIIVPNPLYFSLKSMASSVKIFNNCLLLQNLKLNSNLYYISWFVLFHGLKITMFDLLLVLEFHSPESLLFIICCFKTLKGRCSINNLNIICTFVLTWPCTLNTSRDKFFIAIKLVFIFIHTAVCFVSKQRKTWHKTIYWFSLSAWYAFGQNLYLI